MKYKYVYFLGIGGIGMSAIARWYKFRGLEVSGYDRTPSQLTGQLQAEGIDVHFEDDCSRIPADKEHTLVIYTPAIPESLEEFRFVRDNGYKLVKRSMALGEITADQACAAVAGTHGKTTTSTLIAHILTDSGEGCSAFLGGISKNYGTNLLMSRKPTVVAEADEFDRSFLQLRPTIAVITAMDADHLDIYGDLAHVQDAFREFAALVKETLILKLGLPVSESDTGARIYTYHLDDERADFHATGIKLLEDGHYSFGLAYPGGVLEDIRPGALGKVNIENSVAAAAVCLCLGVDGQKVRRAIGSFKGVQRRLDEHVNIPGGPVYIDDYAHHPAELESAIASIRGMFPGRRITGVFQPHLYTRTRDFAPGFAKALSGLDKLILLDIYPAREEPIEGVDSQLIFKDVTAPEKMLCPRSSLMETLAGESLDVLVTFGAGDIDRFIGPITEMLKARQ
ncbi:MAG: UDP-N-acetylmuramate--L-alanine ligase [Bacteroidales bacterium]|nr:UDP-N-acetylmuramate--L-alanine ligase [Bacteroidales bacterium]